MHRNNVATFEWLHKTLTREQRQSASRIMALSYFMDGALFNTPAASFARYSAHIALSPIAASALESLRRSGQQLDECAFRIAALQLFIHQDFLIDVDKTDPEALRRELHNDTLVSEIRFAQAYGRELYDDYNDRFTIHRADHLESDDALALVSSVESAAYQVGEYLSGPLGIVSSHGLRFLPPKLSLPLWHCVDAGCNFLHEVELQRRELSLSLVRKTLSAFLEAEYGPASDWVAPMQTILLENPSRGGRLYFDMPLIVAEGFHGEDRTSILASLLRSHVADDIKAAIRGKRSDLDAKRIQPERLASELTPAQQLQAIMIADDGTVAATMDALIIDRIIDVPYAEVRRARTETPQVFRDDTGSAVSRLGVRSNYTDPLAEMSTVIWSAYDDCNAVSDLEWRCKQRGSLTNVSSTLEYIRTHEPKDVIADLVLPSRDVTLKVAEHFGLAPSVSADPEVLIDRLLWRMGFDVPLFDRRLAKAKEQIEALKARVISCSEKPNEEERDRIRSSGVNLFVSLENILEELLSFNVWLLMSDHFLVTKYIYRFCDAVKVVEDELSNGLEAEPFQWNPAGGNTLGCSMFYLRKAADLFIGLVLKDREPYLRKEEDLPHYDGQRFAFRHTPLWSDTLDIELKRFANAFSEAVKLFERARIPETRNGLDHHRSEESFPSPGEILGCLALVSEGLDQIIHQRFFPLPIWLERASKDNVGRLEYTFIASPTDRLVLYGPSILLGIKGPQFAEPFVLPFGNLLGYSNSDLIFAIQAESEYSRYWRNYPRRQSIKVTSSGSTKEVEPNQVVESEIATVH
jgi:hypothetical protein